MMMALFLIFEEPPYYFPYWLYQFIFSPNSAQGFIFSHIEMKRNISSEYLAELPVREKQKQNKNER